MDKIIVFPGSADGVFFLNEIDYINKNFDEIIVITYPGDKERFDFLSRDKGFKYFIADINLRNIFTIKFIKWFFCKSTLREISKNLSFSAKSIKKIGYIFLYGLFYLASKRIIDNELEKSKDDDIYLYSFWLTRGAYTVSMYNTIKSNNIKKIISRAHGYDLYENRNILNYLPFRNFINGNLDEIHFISKHGAEYHANKYNLIGSDRKISRLGTFNNENHVKNIVEKDRLCIASCSSVSSIKRLDLIIDILSKIEIPFKWIHIGDGDLMTEIKEYADKKLCNKEFEFLGKLKNEKILSTYIKYDVDFFINMSDSEGVPVSIMEALSIGIPVIARAVGGIPEIIDANTGLLIENINDISYVSNQVNKELDNRLVNSDHYLRKHTECINKWVNEYNAVENYNAFFYKMKSKLNDS
ncbi:MAG: glycosyltransferase [Tissierellia bacterium]|nr:glycosyltransferase [Tissierellia bacterium]